MDTTSAAQDTIQTTSTTMVFDGTVLLFFLVFFVAVYALIALAMGRIFKKAGEAQWKAWVPIYNSWVFLEIGGQKGFWAVLALIPIVNIISLIMLIIAAFKIGENLGKTGAFVLLYIFLPYIWLFWLAFDRSTWAVAAAPNNAAEQAPSFTPIASEPAVEEPTQPTEVPSAEAGVAEETPMEVVETQSEPDATSSQPTSIDGITPTDAVESSPVPQDDEQTSPRQ